MARIVRSQNNNRRPFRPRVIRFWNSHKAWGLSIGHVLAPQCAYDLAIFGGVLIADTLHRCGWFRIISRYV